MTSPRKEQETQDTDPELYMAADLSSRCCQGWPHCRRAPQQMAGGIPAPRGEGIHTAFNGVCSHESQAGWDMAAISHGLSADFLPVPSQSLPLGRVCMCGNTRQNDSWIVWGSQQVKKSIASHQGFLKGGETIGHEEIWFALMVYCAS